MHTGTHAQTCICWLSPCECYRCSIVNDRQQASVTDRAHLQNSGSCFALVPDMDKHVSAPSHLSLQQEIWQVEHAVGSNLFSFSSFSHTCLSSLARIIGRLLKYAHKRPWKFKEICLVVDRVRWPLCLGALWGMNVVASWLCSSFYLYMKEVVSCCDRSVALAVSGAAWWFDAENRAKRGGSSFCLAMMSLLPPSTPLSLFFSLWIFFLTYFLFLVSLWLCFVPHYHIKTCSRHYFIGGA